jgi:hypothetical protein
MGSKYNEPDVRIGVPALRLPMKEFCKAQSAPVSMPVSYRYALYCISRTDHLPCASSGDAVPMSLRKSSTVRKWTPNTH